jgi:hypothetical protein
LKVTPLINLVALTALAAAACGEAPPASTPPAVPVVQAVPKMNRQDVLAARRQYKVKVLSFDAKTGFGSELPKSDLIRLRITNGSKVTLPCLTVLTKRYAKGEMVGSSRAPSIAAVKDLPPGETVEYDYFAKGHFSLTNVNVDRITVEIEGIVDPDDEKFICELQ